jgi:hypothetical protein
MDHRDTFSKYLSFLTRCLSYQNFRNTVMYASKNAKIQGKCISPEPCWKKLKLDDTYTSPRLKTNSCKGSPDPEFLLPFFWPGVDYARSTLLEKEQLDSPDTPWSDTTDTVLPLSKFREKKLEEHQVIEEKLR